MFLISLPRNAGRVSNHSYYLLIHLFHFHFLLLFSTLLSFPHFYYSKYFLHIFSYYLRLLIFCFSFVTQSDLSQVNWFDSSILYNNGLKPSACLSLSHWFAFPFPLLTFNTFTEVLDYTENEKSKTTEILPLKVGGQQPECVSFSRVYCFLRCKDTLLSNVASNDMQERWGWQMGYNSRKERQFSLQSVNAGIHSCNYKGAWVFMSTSSSSILTQNASWFDKLKPHLIVYRAPNTSCK